MYKPHSALSWHLVVKYDPLKVPKRSALSSWVPLTHSPLNMGCLFSLPSPTTSYESGFIDPCSGQRNDHRYCGQLSSSDTPSETVLSDDCRRLLERSTHSYPTT